MLHSTCSTDSRYLLKSPALSQAITQSFLTPISQAAFVGIDVGFIAKKLLPVRRTSTLPRIKAPLALGLIYTLKPNP